MQNNRDYSYFKEAYASDELKKRILDSTVNKIEEPVFKMKKKRLPKLAYAGVTIFVVAILGIGVVFAKEYVEQYILKRQAVNHDDEYLLTLLYPVETTGEANLTCKDGITLEEVEENLGITLLGHNEDFNIVFNKSCDINNDKNGKTMDLTLSSKDSYDFHYTENNPFNKKVGVYLMFYTDYATNEIKEKYVDYEIAYSEGETMITETRYLDSLGVNVTLTDFSGGMKPDYTIASFVYNNVLYGYHLYSFDFDEAMEFLENLE